jgi:hypothetical protein
MITLVGVRSGQNVFQHDGRPLCWHGQRAYSTTGWRSANLPIKSPACPQIRCRFGVYGQSPLVGNSAFKDKKPILKGSGFYLTKMVAEMPTWM